MRFTSFLSGGFITAIVVNPLERNWQNAPLCSGILDFFADLFDLVLELYIKRTLKKDTDTDFTKEEAIM